MAVFKFKYFSVENERSPMKVNTDGVLLGAAVCLSGQEKRILDIGTGTGVIALMLAQRTESAEVTGLEIDHDSFEEALGNFRNSPWKERLEAVEGDLREYIPACRYDLVVSNPPYYDNSLKNPDERVSVARHNVSLHYSDIFHFCDEYLESTGKISLVLPSSEEKSLMRSAGSFGFFPERILRIRSSEKKTVSRIISVFSRERRSPEESLLTIMEGGKYSEEYKSLTGDFYLLL